MDNPDDIVNNGLGALTLDLDDDMTAYNTSIAGFNEKQLLHETKVITDLPDDQLYDEGGGKLVLILKHSVHYFLKILQLVIQRIVDLEESYQVFFLSKFTDYVFDKEILKLSKKQQILDALSEHENLLDEEDKDDFQKKLDELKALQSKREQDKDLDTILSELQQQNINNSCGLNIDKLKADSQQVIDIYENQYSKLLGNNKPIKHLTKSEITEWSNLYKSNDNKDHFSLEMLAILKKGNMLFCDQSLRIVQMLSLMILMKDFDSGKLLQIATGEGKSTTTSLFAIMKALQGHDVDIITSSSILARRDAEERQELFKIFSLSCSANTENVTNADAGKKECYNSKIVYGDVGSFQYDYLSHTYNQKETRGDRKYDVVIVDEVDSMLIDESSKIAMLGKSPPSFDLLNVVYMSIWHELSQISKNLEFADDKWLFLKHELVDDNQPPQIAEKVEIGDRYNFLYNHLKQYIEDLYLNVINGDDQYKISLPKFLHNVIKEKASSWAKSALKAQSLSLDREYIKQQDQNGITKISPVDYSNTGVINTSLHWSEGLHQFLHIKEGLSLEPESLISSFISNLGYFKIYGSNIYGLTGTLGSEDSQSLLKKIYDVDIGFIPTYKEKIFKKHDTIISKSEIDFLDSVSSKVDAIIKDNRAVLIICQTISDANKIKLLFAKMPDNHLKMYTKSDESEISNISEVVNSGNVIIATNLAGRGTDLKISKELEKQGGLHVILTFLPSNLRVEEQALGRAGRQGQPGSGGLIINIDQSNSLLDHNVSGASIEEVIFLRDQVEHTRINDTEFYESKRLAMEDSLFNKFISLSHRLCQNNNHDRGNFKQAQLEERWGMFLQTEQKVEILSRPFTEENLLDKLGLKINKDFFYQSDSLFKGLSSQLQGKYSSEYLKAIAYYVLIDQHQKAHPTETIESIFSKITDEDLIQSLAALLDSDIILIEDSKDPDATKFAATNQGDTGSDIQLYLGRLNVESNLYQYYSLIPANYKAASSLIAAISQHDRADILRDILDHNYPSALQTILLCHEKQEAQKAKIIMDRKDHSLNSHYEEFERHIAEEFHRNYDLITNPAHLVKIGINSNSDDYTRAIKELNLAIELDQEFALAAHYNLAYSQIREAVKEIKRKGKVNTSYLQDVVGNLQEAMMIIHHRLIPNIEIAQALCLSGEDSELMQQFIAKKELLNVFSKHLEKLINKVTSLEGARSYIDIESAVSIFSFYDSEPIEKPAQEEDIYHLYNMGICQTYDLKEAKLSIDWGTAIALGCLGCVQIAIGCLCAVSGNFALAATLIIEGCKDIYSGILVAQGMPFDWKNYVTEKAIAAAIIIGTMGVEKLLQGMELMTVASEATTTNIAANTFKAIATHLTINKVVDMAVDKAAGNLLAELKGALHKSVKSGVDEALLHHHKEKYIQVMSASEISHNKDGSGEITSDTLAILQKKPQLVASVVSKISGAIMKNSAVSGLARAGAGAYKLGSIMNEIKNTDRLADKVVDHLSSVIDKLYSAIDFNKILQLQLARASNVGIVQYERNITYINNQLYAHNYIKDKCLANASDVLEGQQHRGKEPAKITPIVDRPHIYTNKELAEDIAHTGYHLQQVASIARKLALLQEGEYASQAQQISNIIAANTTKLILDRAKGVVTELTDISGAKDVMSDTVELITGKYQNDFIYRVAKKFDKDAQHLPSSIRTNWGAKMHLKDSLKDHLQDRPWLINQIIDEIPKEHLITAAQTMGTKGADLSAVLGYIPSSSNLLNNPIMPIIGVAAGDAYDSDDMPHLEETDDKGKGKEPKPGYEDKGKEAEPKPVKLDNSPFIVPAGTREATANAAPENTASREMATHTASAQDQTADSIIFINQPDDPLSRWFNDPSTPIPPSLSATGGTTIEGASVADTDSPMKLYDARESKYSINNVFNELFVDSSRAIITGIGNPVLSSSTGTIDLPTIYSIRGIQEGLKRVPTIAGVAAIGYGIHTATEETKDRLQHYNNVANRFSENKLEYSRLIASLKAEDITAALAVLPDIIDTSDPHDADYVKHIAVGTMLSGRAEQIQQAKNNAAIRRAALAETYNEDRCAVMRLWPDKELYRHIIYEADRIFPNYFGARLNGIFKHGETAYLTNEYQTKCQDPRFYIEISVKDGQLGVGGAGSSRVDVLSKDKKVGLNAKFGTSGSSNRMIQAYYRNVPNSILTDVFSSKNIPDKTYPNPNYRN